MALSGLVLNGLVSFMRCGIFCELLLVVQRKALLVFKFHQQAAACVFHVVLQIYRSPLNLQSRGGSTLFFISDGSISFLCGYCNVSLERKLLGVENSIHHHATENANCASRLITI